MKKATRAISLFLAVCLLSTALSGCLFHNHTVVDDEPIAPTCTVDGLTGASHCSECGEIINAGTAIPATGHDIVKNAAVEPTCVKAGLTQGSYCFVCGEVLTAQEEIEIISHNYVAKVDTPFSCTADGVNRFTCSICKGSYTEVLPRRTYTPTELFDLASGSVVEITAHDKMGSELRMGSGFILTSDGKVVTNYHVIDKASSVYVYIGDTKYQVRSVEAYDVDIDIAILKINGKDLPAMPICKETHKTGSSVYAFGSSRGFTATFTNGMITHAGREVDGVQCVQHNAAISPGNSGGPLFNEYGEIIGVNAFTIEESQNLNFAISVTELDHLANTKPMTVAAVRDLEHDPMRLIMKFLEANGKPIPIILENDGAPTGFTYRIAYDHEYDKESGLYLRRYMENSMQNTLRHQMEWESKKEDYFFFTFVDIRPHDNRINLFYQDSDGNYVEAEIVPKGSTSELRIREVDAVTGYKEAEVEYLGQTMIALHLLVVASDIGEAGLTFEDFGFPDVI